MHLLEKVNSMGLPGSTQGATRRGAGGWPTHHTSEFGGWGVQPPPSPEHLQFPPGLSVAKGAEALTPLQFQPGRCHQQARPRL